MATNPNSPTGEQAMILQDVTRGLAKVLENRRATTPASCTSPPPTKTPFSLCDKLANILRDKTTLRNAYGISGGSRGFSPSPSASSTSDGASGMGSVSPREGNNIAKPYGRGSSLPTRARVTQARVIRQPEIVEMIQISPIPSPALTVGRGRTGAPLSTLIGGASVKVHKKRKRPSKKAPTTIVEATATEFRAKVQELTGFKDLPPPAVVRPQPKLQQATNAVTIDVDPDSSSILADSSTTSIISAAGSPSPTVSDRVPEAAFSIHDHSSTAASSPSKSSVLNYTMGYDQDTPPFLEQDYDETGGFQPTSDSGYSHTAQPMQHKGHEVSTTAARPTRSTVQEAAPLASESSRKEGIPRESGSGSSMPDHSTTPSSFLGPCHHRAKEALESDIHDMESIFDYGWTDILDVGCSWWNN